MSPLQLQKQLRLQEARRLLLGENLDAASAGYRVSYDDASQFSREYKRLFGQPPCGPWNGCARWRGGRPAASIQLVGRFGDTGQRRKGCQSL
jgi:AraC-like DNA-binding protein